MDTKQLGLTKYLSDILAKALDNKVYGSVEIYYQAGKIIQVTERIIKKIDQQKGKR